MKISYRRADNDDAKLLFDWANDPVVRESSFHTGAISWDNHVNWYNNRLQDKNTKILIFQLDNRDIGVVRIEIKDKVIIGISIDADFRGKKLAPKMLIIACELFWKESELPIYAYIKKENAASIKSFEKAGFALLQEDIINGFESIELICKK